MGEDGPKTTFKSSTKTYEFTFGMNFSTNESSNTSQIVMELGINELCHSRVSSRRVCRNNLYVTFSSVRLK
jgi:hypothetical protein